MLRVFGSGAQDCDGVTRRSFLQAGMLGVGGLALPELLQASCRGGDGRRRQQAERHPVLAQRRARAHGDLGPQARRPARLPRPVRRHPHERARSALR